MENSDRLVRIAVVGDRDDSVRAHRGIVLSLEAGVRRMPRLSCEWVGTESITRDNDVAAYAGIWCVPNTPYRSRSGALVAISYARRNNVPFLGTCGGFHHAVIEFAGSVLGLRDADDGQTSPGAMSNVITPLLSGMVEREGEVRPLAGTRLHRLCGDVTTERYHCRYGIAPDTVTQMAAAGFTVTAVDAEGDARAMELDGHPFFVGTLFQPERAALRGTLHPLVEEFFSAAAATTR